MFTVFVHEKFYSPSKINGIFSLVDYDNVKKYRLFIEIIE